MEGIGLDNVLGAAEVEQMFSAPSSTEESPEKESADTSVSAGVSEESNDVAEVDFSDLIGSQPESVGNGESLEGTRETPASENDTGAPSKNAFSSIARALKEEGVFPDLSDEVLESINDAASFRKMFDDQVSNSLNERQKRIESAINGGATSEEVKGYQNDLAVVEFLESQEATSKLEQESEEGETLRKQMMYQDYINRGFSEERAKKLVMKSIDDGTDIDDAKEAYQSCKNFYKQRIQTYEKYLEDTKRSAKENEERQYSNLKKQIVDTEDFFGGVKVDKNTRQKAYDSLTKPVYKDENGNYLTAMQKYQRENPMDFMKNVALMYSLTDGFKNIDKLTKSKVNAGIKKGFAAFESALNNTRRNSDGTLNFANGEPSAEDRENWTLAI